MTHDAIGLDIGGANIKAATASGRTWTHAFELWRQPERLAGELVAVRDQFGDLTTVAITMTGELCDCFHTKRDGVTHILHAVADVFTTHTLHIWTTQGTFLNLANALTRPLEVAAANWLATATLAARMVPRSTGLLIDTGTTTTDIIPLANGHAVPWGRTDPERLRSGELVYTGVKRTPVCAVLGAKVAAEWFATTHDVYVLLGQLPEEPANRDTADRRPQTIPDAHARLSRMLGGDAEITLRTDTQALAAEAFATQRAHIGAGLQRVVARLPAAPTKVLVAGSGEFLAEAAWRDFAPTVPVMALRADMGPEIAEAAAAYAVATLATEHLTKANP